MKGISSGRGACFFLDESLDGARAIPISLVGRGKENMEEKLEISVVRGKRIEMIHQAGQLLRESLARIAPPFDDKTDMVKLSEYQEEADRIRLWYAVFRDARPPRELINKSPYREKGITMKVGVNS